MAIVWIVTKGDMIKDIRRANMGAVGKDMILMEGTVMERIIMEEEVMEIGFS